MTEKHKELLLKDLCARLPYGVKMINTEPYSDNHNPILTLSHISEDNAIGCRAGKGFMTTSLGSIKPYLFPMSSMTEEQKKKAPFESSLLNAFINGYIALFEDEELTVDDIFKMTDWLNKNHFDYRGLIPMGLAIDATNLNIY